MTIDNKSYHEGYIMFDVLERDSVNKMPTMYAVPASTFRTDDYDVVSFTACGYTFNSVTIDEDKLIAVKHLWKEVDEELNVIEPIPEKKESLFETLGRIFKPNQI